MKPKICRDYLSNKTCSYGRRCRFLHVVETDILDPPRWIFSCYKNLPLNEYSPEEMYYFYKTMVLNGNLNEFKNGFDDLWMNNYKILYEKICRLNKEDNIWSGDERDIDLRDHPEIFIQTFDNLNINKKISELRDKEKEDQINNLSLNRNLNFNERNKNLKFKDNRNYFDKDTRYQNNRFNQYDRRNNNFYNDRRIENGVDENRSMQQNNEKLLKNHGDTIHTNERFTNRNYNDRKFYDDINNKDTIPRQRRERFNEKNGIVDFTEGKDYNNDKYSKNYINRDRNGIESLRNRQSEFRNSNSYRKYDKTYYNHNFNRESNDINSYSKEYTQIKERDFTNRSQDLTPDNNHQNYKDYQSQTRTYQHIREHNNPKINVYSTDYLNKQKDFNNRKENNNEKNQNFMEKRNGNYQQNYNNDKKDEKKDKDKKQTLDDLYENSNFGHK